MNTSDLDATITLLNDMLGKSKSNKEKLAITDRLLKCHAMKLKFTDEGKGTKFNPLPTTEATHGN